MSVIVETLGACGKVWVQVIHGCHAGYVWFTNAQPAQSTRARLLSDGEGALTVMTFFCGLVSSLECLRLDSLPADAKDGAIVSAAAGGL